MPEIYIPFTHGQSEAIDPKLLPQGLFLSAKDCRYLKDARLAVRNAYVGQPVANIYAAANYDKGDDLYIASNGGGNTAYGSKGGALGQTLGTNLTYQDVPGGQTTVPRLMSSAPMAFSTLRAVASCATLHANGFLYVAYTVIDSTSKTPANYNAVDGRYIYLAKVDRSTGAILAQTSVNAGFATVSNVKLAYVNSLVCVFYCNQSANTVRMSSYNNSTLAVSTDDALVVTAQANKAVYFDVSQGGSATEAYLVYQSAATTLNFGTVTSAGVYTSLNTIAGTNSELRASICQSQISTTDRVVIVWLDGASFTTGNARYTVYRRSTTSFVIATTNAYTGGDCTGYPGAGSQAAAEAVLAFNLTGTGGTLPGIGIFQHGDPAFDNVKNVHSGLYLLSKPFNTGGANFMQILATDASVYDATNLVTANYFMASCKKGQNFSPTVMTEFSQLKGLAAEVSTIYKDPRQTVPVDLPTISSAPGSTALAFCLGGKTSAANFFYTYRTEVGSNEDHFNSAKLNGDIHFAGSRITAYDGRVITEMGFSLPATPTLSAGAGSIAVGTYQVVVIWEWFDNKGRRHRSAPSNPASITLSSPGGINVTITRPYATNKNLQNTTDGELLARIYRTTLAQPSIFQEAMGSGLAMSPTTGATTLLVLTDTQMASNENLYTQGAVGGLSGRLQNDRPPGARYICAGSDRLMIGGMENPSEVWWSKIRTEGEPMQWVNNATWKAQIDGVVTAVAQQDGTWFIATYNTWWAVSGAGPEDNGSNGSFGAPVQLPSPIGCISHKSIVYTEKGFIFQGANDRMYLMPRGGSAPQPIGWQVRDTLNSFPFITASVYDKASNVAYWACSNTAGTAGRLLVYDTRLNEWYVDNYNSRVINTLSLFNSLLRIDGISTETVGSTQDDDGTTQTSVYPYLETGDVIPFGMSGHGALRKAIIKGEDLDNNANAYTISMNVSYDSGKTYADPASWPVANLITNGLDPFEAEHMLLYPKGTSYRFKITWSSTNPTKGAILNGLSLWIFPETGLSRLPQARRT